MLVPVGPIRIILQIVKFKNQEPRDSINGKSHRTMQAIRKVMMII